MKMYSSFHRQIAGGRATKLQERGGRPDEDLDRGRRDDSVARRRPHDRASRRSQRCPAGELLPDEAVPALHRILLRQHRPAFHGLHDLRSGHDGRVHARRYREDQVGCARDWRLFVWWLACFQDTEHENYKREAGVFWRDGCAGEGDEERRGLRSLEGLHAVLREAGAAHGADVHIFGTDECRVQ